MFGERQNAVQNSTRLLLHPISRIMHVPFPSSIPSKNASPASPSHMFVTPLRLSAHVPIPCRTGVHHAVTQTFTANQLRYSSDSLDGANAG